MSYTVPRRLPSGLQTVLAIVGFVALLGFVLWWEFSDFVSFAPPSVIVLNAHDRPAMRQTVSLRSLGQDGTVTTADTDGQGRLFFHRLSCSKGCEVTDAAYLETRRDLRGQETKIYSLLGTLRFTVLSPDGSPVAGLPVTVRFKRSRVRQMSAVTDAAGKFTFAPTPVALTERDLEIIPSRPGQKVIRMERRASGDQVNFRLTVSGR